MGKSALVVRQQALELNSVHTQLLDDQKHVKVFLGLLDSTLVVPHVLFVTLGAADPTPQEFEVFRCHNVAAVSELVNH